VSTLEARVCATSSGEPNSSIELLSVEVTETETDSSGSMMSL